VIGAEASNISRKALKTLHFVLFMVALWLITPVSALAQDDVDAVPAEPVQENVETLNRTLVADLVPDFKVILEGEELGKELVSKGADGGVFVRAEPIFEALNDEFEYNLEEGTLIVHRSQDGVVMELYTDTGVVKANGKTLGKLKAFGEIREGMLNLTPNAIAVLSGAIGKIDENENIINFELDPRLKVATGFDVIVNDVPLGDLEPGPKSIGSVMLLPLRPIAEELGHDIQIIESGAAIIVRRAQDSAEFELNLNTGLVKLNGRPYGVTKDVSYIEDINLLLPISAIETLTGTHISVEAGSSTINVELDGRLKGAIEPGEAVDDITGSEPFIVETLQFHAGTDTLNTAELDFRVKGSNGRLRYEIPDLPMGIEEAEPAWLSLDFAHKNGITGSLGDYSADYRELDGVDLNRIRGASVVKTSQKGRWAIAAGVPAAGSKIINEDQSRLTFDGFAAGARYADIKGWEAGVSYKADGITDDQMAVLSAISGRLGRKRTKDFNWDAGVDIGTFSGSARTKSVDVRGDVNTRYEINNNVSVNAFASYDGSEFLRRRLDTEEREEALNPDDLDSDPDQSLDLSPDIRNRGSDHARYGASVQVAARRDIGPFNRPAGSVRYRHSQSGVFVGKDEKNTVDNIGVSINTAIIPIDTNISADWNVSKQTLADGTNEDGDRISARIYKNTDYATARVQIQAEKRNDGPRETRIDAHLSAKPLNVPFSKNAKLTVAPSIAGSWSGRGDYVRGGVVSHFNSGDLLGKETKAHATLAVLQSFSGNSDDRSDTFLTLGIGRKLPINKNLSLGMSYRNNLRGEQHVGLFLDGRFDFNEKRKFKSTQEGRGVLKGRVFLDKNRDNIKQEDEPGIGGVIVSVKPGRLALRTDRDGYYTIQNIKKGLHTVGIEGRSLPLGYTLADDATVKATVDEGRITDVPLPVVQRGQIRGFAFIDQNGDGVHNTGETRLEGAKLSLTKVGGDDEPKELYAASFGQYAFDDLAAGEYELSILKTNSQGSTPSAPIIVDLGKEQDLMRKVNIAARATEHVESADLNSANGSGHSVITGLEEEVPPPDNPAP